MPKVTRDAALKYHASGKPGKIEVIPTKPHSTQTDLSLAYSPGVAEPCLEIEKDPRTAYDYTAKGNLVAVISNGTAVLGLGNIGALAGKPVMEGKGLLFKIFAGIDVFDIEVDETDPDKFIQTVKAIAPTFGGINLEDIKSPECFEIERRLKEELNIPVMHDDQHGTAIISAAALLNALDLTNRDISKIRIIINGAGASAVACTKLYMKFGLRKENIIMCDRHGVLNTRRTDLDKSKAYFAVDTPFDTLAEAIKGADVFVGLSVGNVLTKEMVRTMNANPIVFALANPDPEISYEDAMSSREDIIFATGRSDYPNQVNNVLGFPYIFRGALDVRATTINEPMELAAARAIAQLAKEPVPDVINTAYELKRVSFGREYIIPKPMDPRLLTVVSSAVAKAAMDTGVAQREITDWEAYENSLSDMLGYSNKLIHRLTNLAKSATKKVVYCEGNHINMIKAAVFSLKSEICSPILLGSKERIYNLANENGLDLTGIEVIDHRSIDEDIRRARYAKILSERKSREGIFYQEAFEKMNDRNYFGMMMVETGDADAVITGIYSQYRDFARTSLEVIGLKPGYNHFAAMHIVQTRRGPYFLADTLINRWPDADALKDIVRLTHDSVRYFTTDPVMAMLSFSNFGTEDDGTPKMVSDVIRYFHENYPEYDIDGEMQLNFAMNKELRDEKFPFNKIKGKDVNTLIFPNLSSSNIASKLLIELGIGGESIGPIQMGLRKPVHFMDVESPVRDIINITTVAVVEAITNTKK
ncbi:NADP-dependent malic enzyme [Dysgonomonas sp. 511]|uniref:NADP-dependent malic enzyme n=1 Tax=Dysgonomonas sp. 511 TaxID=2302930 RepID=UPI0013D02FC8|nr:NADP-dependent malic enzyme [Dysgonomonas sp. 511]NDV79577.1 NADP-dependent malic enzyme [Dysgonomonas sp. 511]